MNYAWIYQNFAFGTVIKLKLDLDKSRKQFFSKSTCLTFVDSYISKKNSYLQHFFIMTVVTPLMWRSLDTFSKYFAYMPKFQLEWNVSQQKLHWYKNSKDLLHWNILMFMVFLSNVIFCGTSSLPNIWICTIKVFARLYTYPRLG